MLRMWISWHVFLDFLDLSHWICVRFCLWKQTVVEADASRNLWRNNILVLFLFITEFAFVVWLMKKKPDKPHIVHTIQCVGVGVHTCMWHQSGPVWQWQEDFVLASGSKDGEERSVSFAAIKHCRFGCQGVCARVCVPTSYTSASSS